MTDDFGNVDVKKSLKNYLELHQDEILAVNTEKANKMLRPLGLQLPPGNTFISFDNSIAYTTTNVKYSEKNKPRPVQCAWAPIVQGLKQP